MSSSQPSYTGHKRQKKNRLSVRFGDLAAQALITVGGIGTIVAVSLVFVFLFFVVAPLFSSATLELGAMQKLPWDGQPIALRIDEYQTMGWALHADGRLQVFRLDTGEVLETKHPFGDKQPTAVSSTVGKSDLAVGFADGSVQLGHLRFKTTFREDVPEKLRDNLAEGESATLEQGVVQRTPQGQFRLQRLAVDFGGPVSVGTAPIRLIDHIMPEESAAGIGNREILLGVFDDSGAMRFGKVLKKENDFTGETEWQADLHDLEFAAHPGSARSLLVTGRGDNVILSWEDGHTVRFDVRNLSKAKVVQTVDVLSAADAQLTAATFVLGRETILFGDSQGGLRAWFRVRDSEGKDGFRLAMVHELPAAEAGVASLGASERSRMVGAGYDDGSFRVFHVTTDQVVIEEIAKAGHPAAQMVMSPKDNGLVVIAGKALFSYEFDPGYPEATLASLFWPVWYEGYAEPIQMWQSSFAGVSSEMKLGLWPLIFGTIKATFYTMLFGAPLALLAAIYTSEFLNPKVRGRIKPAIEMMASLPSVVLGFLAALVFAPYVERMVPGTLAAMVTLPVALLLGAYLWQLLPSKLALRLEGLKFFLFFVALGTGVALAYALGPLVERWFFAGDLMRWLDGQIGNGIGAWMMLLLPASALVTAFLVMRWGNGVLRKHAHRWTRFQFATMDLLKFGSAIAFSLLLAYGVSSALNAVGLDPRGSFVDTYVQRNALVVGFVMGFAVIPIIYTIADDALVTVPSHLRSASLGCGATPWQTAVRVVIPTAMSGLFSALMIGLGRAVGETMIVLMAGGNTPVAEWNIFNGFRTLSANIAVELPEAVRDSTHYRTLFLAALTLFVMTFVLNTVAEIVRLRFRKRAYQL